jgi:hypothetical protein
MIGSIAAIFARSNEGVSWPVLLIALIAAVAFILASSWQFVVQWLNGIRGRDWPTVSAVIDLVSVQKRVQSVPRGKDIVTYVAMLTYAYRNPDLQTGDYDKPFYDEGEALAWANSYKGCTVMIHVDPRDSSRSVLRKEDLEGVTS